jgi:hypothetical protein
MSRPVAIARVTVFVLISLVLIAATSVGVRGWLGSTHQATGTHAVSGLYTDFNHQRSTTAELQSLQLLNGTSAQPSGAHQGGCHSNGQVSPQD